MNATWIGLPRSRFFTTCLWLLIVSGLQNVSGQQTHAVAGAFQTVQGKYITLKSDARDRSKVSDWVDAFDAAVPQWCDFFDVSIDRMDEWKVDGFIIGERRLFVESGDLPPQIPLKFGFAIHGNVWVTRQKGDYYTRHLLLHEGVHAFMLELFGFVGPAWYAEGLAELLSVHQGQGASVRVGGVPANNASVPYWGRFPLIRAARDREEVPTLQQLFRYGGDLQGDVESYGWVWLLLLMLSEHDDYRSAVLAASEDLTMTRSRFMARFRERLERSWPIVQARWRLTASTVDYGFDWDRERCQLSIKDPLWDGRSNRLRVDPSKGWQSVGVRLKPGQVVRLSARGRCTLGQDPKPWVSEPAGVTIRYVGDRPLGQLLFCLLPNQTSEERWLSPLKIQSLETTKTVTVDRHCWLLLRVNDAASELADNQGSYEVTFSLAEKS